MSLDQDARRELERLRARDRLRVPRVVEGRQGVRVRVDGADVVSFASNDYLGLAGDPRLAAAAVRTLERVGVGAGSSRLIVGNQREHVELEEVVADWMRCTGARVFNTGYAANVGVVTALTGAGDTVFSDELNHASLIDGCRLSRARVVVYPHANLEVLAERLAEPTSGRKVVVSESVFSMDGDIAPVAELAALCARFDAALFLDEAHAVGVFGPKGRGVAAELGVVPDVVIGTFGKAVGTSGAFVATTRAIAELLWNRARPFVFSTNTPAAIAAATVAAIEVVRGREGDERRERVRARIGWSREVLGAGVETQIVPLVVGDDRRLVEASRAIFERGYLVGAVRPPTVPEGTARLRLSISSAHEAEDLRDVLEVARSVIR